MTPERFEYAVVGGGKGGKTLAVDLARQGHRTVLVERGMIGGSCINVACIPTKTIVRSAKVAELARHAADYGVRVTFAGIDPTAVRRRKQAVVDGMVKLNQANFDRSGMTFLIGSARFTGPHAFEVRLNDGTIRQLEAEKIFINTGTKPALPPLPGLAETKPLTSESIQELERLPEHLIVLGGGYIGLEFAQIFRRFGSRVTVLERGERFLPREDADIAEQIRSIFVEDGIDILLGTEIEQFEGQSGSQVKLRLRTPAGGRALEGSDLLAAVGRSPNTADLNLAAAGVQVDARGFVTVNERLETTAPDIWALGDVNGGPQFTHASLDDYRIIKTNLAGGKRTTRDRIVPYTLFIDPELGRAGLTEEEARRQGRNIKIARMPAAVVPRARTLGETHGYWKAIIDADTNRILGVAILAPEGGEVMATVLVAIRAGLPYTDLRDAIFAHPTMAEGLNDLFARVE
jgi:pyruvate/2-oxoglutarate dehydrogenase complex dihydrolipoamide dehydrogenase (E3) component